MQWLFIGFNSHYNAFLSRSSAASSNAYLSFPDLAYLSLYPRRLYSTAILAIYDSDPAGDLARAYLSQYTRVTLRRPPAHDLTDYWRFSGNIQSWLTSHLQ